MENKAVTNNLIRCENTHKRKIYEVCKKYTKFRQNNNVKKQ